MGAVVPVGVTSPLSLSSSFSCSREQSLLIVRHNSCLKISLTGAVQNMFFQLKPTMFFQLKRLVNCLQARSQVWEPCLCRICEAMCQEVMLYLVPKVDARIYMLTKLSQLAEVVLWRPMANSPCISSCWHPSRRNSRSPYFLRSCVKNTSLCFGL